MLDTRENEARYLMRMRWVGNSDLHSETHRRIQKVRAEFRRGLIDYFEMSAQLDELRFDAIRTNYLSGHFPIASGFTPVFSPRDEDDDARYVETERY